MKSISTAGLVSLLVPAFLFAQAAAKHDLAVHVALVSADKSETIRNILALAEVKLSDAGGIALLERQAVDKVLAEQKLSLSGLVASDHAVAVGKLLGVELFAVLEPGADKDSVGLVVFDGQTGARLWDAALPGGGVDAAVRGTVDGVQAARQKRQSIEKLRTVCLLTVRNADLPRDRDGFCDSVGLLLERRLITSPDLVLLERRRLELVTKERDVPVDSPLRALLASVVVVELEIGRSADGKGLRATALLSDARGKSIGKTVATIAKQDAVELANAVFEETARALHVKVATVSDGQSREAGRFLREAEFFWEHKDPHRALPAAESAYALQPGAPTLRVALARGLLAEAREVLDPGGRLSVGFFVRKVDPNKLEVSLELARRGSETLIEAESVTGDTALKPPGNVHKAIAENLLHSYLQMVDGLTEGVSTAHRAGIETVRGNQQRMMDIRLERAETRLHDKASFEEYTQQVSNSLMRLMTHVGSTESSQQWATAIQRLRAWAAAARKYADVRAAGSISMLSRLLFTYRYEHKIDKAAATKLQEVWGELAEHPNLTIAVYGRLGGMTNALTFGTATAEQRQQKVHEYRLFIQDRLDKGAQPDVLRLNLYMAAKDGIDLLINRPGYGEELQGLCEFMLAHQELAPTVAQMTGFHFLTRRTHAGYQYAYDVLQRSLDIMEGNKGRFLTYADSAYVLKFDRDRIRKELLRMQSEVRQADPTVGPPPKAPWEKVELLLDVYENKQGTVWLQQPVVHDGAVWVAAIAVEGEPVKHFVHLIRFTPGGEAKREGRRLEIALPFQPWAGSKERPFRLNVSFGTTACVHKDRYYLGTKKDGIFAFPLTGDLPERITTADGLPSDSVQALTALGDKLYAYLGEPDKDSAIIAWDIGAKKCAVLASSRRKEKRSPFDDNTPLVSSVLLADTTRNRVLFSAFFPYTQHPLNGVWAIDAKTEAFERLFILHHSDIGLIGPSSRIEGDQLVMPSAFGVFRFDLVKKEPRLLYDKVSLEVGPLRSAVFGLKKFPAYSQWTDGSFNARPPYVVVQGWLWAAQPFSRRTLDGGTEELLAGLRPGQKFFQPTECLQMFQGDRELLIGDSFGLWLVTLPRAK
jgi:hypothetical protein